MKLYVAGPMRGLPEFNFPAFDAAAEALIELGHSVFSPAARDRMTGFDPVGMDGNEDLSALGFSLREALAADVEFIAEVSEAIIVLPGWQRSTGVHAEIALARALSIPVYELEDFLDNGDGPLGADNVLDGLPLATQGTADETLHGGAVKVTSATGGSKGKKPLEVGGVDPLARAELGKVAAFGAQKYDRGNYLKGYDWSLCVDAMHRHILAFESGEDLDEETGLPHMAHAAWHGLALTSFYLRGIGTDDRFAPPSN